MGINGVVGSIAQAEKYHDAAKKVTNTLRAAHNLTSKVIPYMIPEQVGVSIQATKFVSPITLFFTIPQAIKNIRAAHFAESITQRIKKIVESLLSLFSIPISTIDTISALEAVKAIPKQGWLPIVGKILWPVQFLGLGLGLYDFSKTIALDQALKKHKDVNSCYHYILENRETIKETLKLPDAIEKEERGELVKTVQRRMSTKLTFHVLDTALKIATIVATGFAIFAPVTLPILVVLLVLSVANLALFGTEKFVMSRNPFIGRRQCQ